LHGIFYIYTVLRNRKE